MSLFGNNSDVKGLFFRIIAIALTLALLFLLTTWLQVKQFQKQHIRHNTAFIGTLIKFNPHLEEEIITAFILDSVGEYEVGAAVLDKYSYNEELGIRLTPIVNSFHLRLMLFTTLFLLLFVTGICYVIIKDYKVTYNKIRDFSAFSKAVIEGENVAIPSESKEGDIHILSNRLNQMASTLREHIEKLDNERALLKDNITNISHQLKTPISSLIMFNEILRNGTNMDIEERRRFDEMSLLQLERMEGLTKKLLKLARLDAKVVEFNSFLSPIEQTIQQAVQGLQQKARGKDINLTIKGDRNILLKHDPEWMSEAINNIVENAVQHTNNNGQIKICWTQNPISIEIIIKDNGNGIPQDEIHKVFMRFYKGKQNINPASTGVGLALAKEIIEHQGGNITVTSAQGQGTQFTITFLKNT